MTRAVLICTPGQTVGTEQEQTHAEGRQDDIPVFFRGGHKRYPLPSNANRPRADPTHQRALEVAA